MARALDCPSCGAPVRWLGEARVVECRYCGQRVLTDSWQATAEPAAVRSRMRPRNQALLVLLPFLATLSVGVLTTFVALLQPHESTPTMLGPKRHTQADLNTLSLATSPEVFGQALDLTSHSANHQTVQLQGMGFDYAAFSWTEDHPGCATSVSFHADGPHPNAANIEAWLAFYLGRRLEHQDKGRLAWSWASTYLWFDEDRAILGMHVDPAEDPDWQYRMQLLWSILLASISGQDLGLDASILRDWLGWGYPLSTLARLDPTWTVDQARRQVPPLLPGATEEKFISLDFDIPLDHPWLGRVEASWTNAQNGRLSSLTFWPPPAVQEFPDQEAMRRCLAGLFGQPTIHELDHLDGTWYGRWNPAGLGSLLLYPNHLSISVADLSTKPGPPTRDTWSRLTRGLQACAPQEIP